MRYTVPRSCRRTDVVPLVLSFVLPTLLSSLLLACGEAAPERGRIAGRVLFQGSPPDAAPLDMSSVPVCESLHDGPVTERSLVVGAEGGLAQTFVVLRGITADAAPAPPEEPAVLTQRNCLFEPRVVGVQVGQPLLVRNADPTYHNVVAEPEANPGFDLSQPFEGMESRVVFEQPELMIPVRSNAHPWMEAWLCVVEHPWFAVTGEDGSFSLDSVPPGDYRLEVRHEELGRQETPITVTTDQTTEVELAFD